MGGVILAVAIVAIPVAVVASDILSAMRRTEKEDCMASWEVCNGKD